MMSLPEGLWDKFNGWLEREQVDGARHGDYRKWLRYYLDFCHKYGHGYLEERSLGSFARKLESKGQGRVQVDEASRAVRIYYRMAAGVDDLLPTSLPDPETPIKPPMPGPLTEGASWADELVRLSEEIRVRHYSPKTVACYYGWAKKFQAYVLSKPPALLDTDDVKRYLTWLATEKEVAASTQNQAFNALLFFYRNVLGKEFGKVDGGSTRQTP